MLFLSLGHMEELDPIQNSRSSLNLIPFNNSGMNILNREERKSRILKNPLTKNRNGVTKYLILLVTSYSSFHSKQREPQLWKGLFVSSSWGIIFETFLHSYFQFMMFLSPTASCRSFTHTKFFLLVKGNIFMGHPVKNPSTNLI